MKIDLATVVLLVLLAVVITVAVASPKARKWAVGIGLLLAGAIGGKKLSELGDDEPPAPPDDDEPDTVPIPDPTTHLQTELADEHDSIDSLPDDDLADAWSEHGGRAADD